jgi:hypothetical protein
MCFQASSQERETKVDEGQTKYYFLEGCHLGQLTGGLYTREYMKH